MARAPAGGSAPGPVFRKRSARSAGEGGQYGAELVRADDPFPGVARFYRDRIARYGSDVGAVDWATPASQRLRFEVLAEVAALDGLAVLDVGCGLGHFADYLAEHAPSARYVGIDLTPEAVAAARRDRPNLELLCGNILDADLPGPFDVVVANGIFYLLGSSGSRLMPQLVSRMYELAGTAVAFTSLSTWAAAEDPLEFHADPIETLASCRALTPRLTLRHDYHPGDFTVYLYRPGSAR